ncbi:basic helix-loop-helix (bHLH) DNA-binding family protein isoform X2 [Wolffia australiana]
MEEGQGRRSGANQSPFDPFQEAFTDQVGLPGFSTLSWETNPALIRSAPSSSSPPTQLFEGSDLSELFFPTATNDDAAIARAMMAVMSSSSPLNQVPQGQWPGQGGAFGPYLPAQQGRRVSQGQGMMKRSFSLLRRMGEDNMEEAQPSPNQLHHVLSERRRREKLNESFSALRALLPHGTKKDQPSILMGTIEQAKTLKAQISELEEKNRAMELILFPGEEEENNGENTRKERIQINRVSHPSSSKQEIDLRVIVSDECDLIDLVLCVLRCLRERPHLEFLSLESGVYVKHKSDVSVSLLTIRLRGREEEDDEHFKEALSQAINEAST